MEPHTNKTELSKSILNNKYKQFIPPSDKMEAFITEINQIKQLINLTHLNTRLQPIFIYNGVPQNALQYLLAVNYSLHSGRVLNYTSVRAQTFVRQHFADRDRDTELYDNIYYTDLLFITLTQADYTSEYMESLLQDLVTFRQNRGTHTVVIYEVIDKRDKSYMGYTKKLRDFFTSNNYATIDLLQGITTPHNATRGNMNQLGNKPKGNSDNDKGNIFTQQKQRRII